MSADKIAKLEAALIKAADALAFMLIEQAREGFGDEFDDLKRGREALELARATLSAPE